MIFLLAATLALVGLPTWHDGDSGRLGGVRVRIDAIDAPELKGSPKCDHPNPVWSCSPAAMRYGRQARDRLRALTIKGVECRAEEEDQYDRSIVRCRLPDGRDPAAILVREGLARPDLRYGGRRYLADEAAARAARRGAWK
jgi:endonuclease YncB( thermonuclease family)